MNTPTQTSDTVLHEVAQRIRELREIEGYSAEQTAKATEVSVDLYKSYESGAEDLPFTFIHKCALFFGVELADLLEGTTPRLRSYTVNRKGDAPITARETGIEIRDLAHLFRGKLAEPYWVTYEYLEEQQNKPINVVTHAGQEFDIVLEGRLKVQIGDHTEVLGVGDTILYNSSVPHGMIAIEGAKCVFCAVVLPGESSVEEFGEKIAPVKTTRPLIYEEFIEPVEDENGSLLSIGFKNENRFNFAFDIVDALAEKSPDKLAMLHVDRDKTARRFTFADMSKQSSRAANYFRSLGINKGDRVMLVLKRNYQFWISMLALHKLGAVTIPAPDQLLQKDFEYRFNAGKVSAIVCTGQSDASAEAEKAFASCPYVTVRVMANGVREGWHDFDKDINMFRSSFPREEDTSCGKEPILMFFSSGTTGYPKMVEHTHLYGLGHFITAKYWHCVDPDGIHFTISDTGWGKALWGKFYGQWLCESAVFTYDFDRFEPTEILSMFSKFGITTFCAPPTMLRYFIREDLSKYDLSSVKYVTTAGEALNPEVFHKFKEATGLTIMEGFGQTETTLTICNLVGMTPKIGAMGKASPMYDVLLLDSESNEVPTGETGEICIRTSNAVPCGLFTEYFLEPEKTKEVWHDGYYHTGDTAYRDEDGYFWYIGRVDDLIKSSGYRIGPFEIESVIMELPYVLECGVSAAPDELRGQVVKASVVLVKGTEATEELKKEIQEYVKSHTAPYKYPRIVIFRDELPKTINGKLQRSKL